MSNKSQNPSEFISLPKGGGALCGIGEKFSPDLFTGTGNLVIPIAVPPGRNEFQPELNLAYSTGNGNSSFGLGWGISIPEVSRKTSQSIPLYDDNNDTFVISSSEDLVLVETQKNKKYYRPRTEGTFARIIHIKNQNSDYWEVKSKDGLVSYYGITPDMLQNEPAIIADPTDRTKIFSWKLTKTKDPFGNMIEYKYQRDMHENGSHNWDQLYLKEIRYIDYDDGDITKFLVSVNFHYEDRPDPFSSYRSGFEIRTVKRCAKIVIKSHTDDEKKIRTYNLKYYDKIGPLKELPPNGISLLKQIETVGHDGDVIEKMPPLEVDYTKFEPEKRDFFSIKGSDLPPISLTKPEYELVDLFSNGLPDILEMNSLSVRYWRNLGNGSFDLPREMKTAPAGIGLADEGVQIIDADGDGKIDLMVTKPNGLSGYYPLRFDGTWDSKSFKKYSYAPSFNLKDPEVRLIDLTGDGITDAIHSSSRLECYFNDKDKGWHDVRYIERKSIDDFPNVNFSDPRVKLGDLSGDGMQDIILVHDGNIEYWPNLGYGRWRKRISMDNSPRFPYGYNPNRILIGDIDGDGLADIVYVDDNKITLWINQSGNSWSQPIVIHGTPPVSDMDNIRLVDLLGNGVSGILWSMDEGYGLRTNMFYLDLIGGKKPYLLSEINNNIGALTHIEYSPSTNYYLKDQKQLKTRWKTPLPFPVHVVSKVEAIDQISKGKLSTEYYYHHGYWDGGEREFRGFGRVDQRDTEVFEEFHKNNSPIKQSFNSVSYQTFSPPIETRTWFHQGPLGDEFGDWEETDFSDEFWQGDKQVLSRPQSMEEFLKNLPRRIKRDALRTLRGRILRTELYAIDGTELQNRPYTVTELLHGVMSLPLGSSFPDNPKEWQLKIFFPVVLAERTTQWERGDEPLTQFIFIEDYDEYGQPCSNINIAVPRGRNFNQTIINSNKADGKVEPYLATMETTTYAQRNDEIYIVNRVARTTSYEIINDGSLNIFKMKREVLNDSTCDGIISSRIIQQETNYYDGIVFIGEDFGKIGKYGALVRTEKLIFTEEILQEAYKNNSNLIFTKIPPYLSPDGSVIWTEEYPQKFRNQLPLLAGYIYHQQNPDSEYATGYFTAIKRRSYDFHNNSDGKGRGLITITRDPLGADTRIGYDKYKLLPEEIIDSTELKTMAKYNYKFMELNKFIDQNGNQQLFTFTPLGLLHTSSVMGKVGENVGDTIEEPSTELIHDFWAFVKNKQPISVRTIQRIHHSNDTDIPIPKRDETIESIEYSDGFGRQIQKRIQAEDIIFASVNNIRFGDAGIDKSSIKKAEGHKHESSLYVTVSGWQTYDNKGHIIEKYEPFFSVGWDYEYPIASQLGQKTVMYYDPRGNIIKTINPDDSEQRVIYGISTDISDPEQFTPTPWEQYTYDSNDNAGRTHNDSSTGYTEHWNTPTSTKIDALGRIVEKIERKGKDFSDWYTTQYNYDIKGNLLTVIDTFKRIVSNSIYDFTNTPIQMSELDSGVTVMIMNSMGNIIEQRDSKGALSLYAYDTLHRQIHLWARNKYDDPITLREYNVYGDSKEGKLTESQAAELNLLGKIYKQYDEAGLLVFEKYDYKGNIIEKFRKVMSDSIILSAIFPAKLQNNTKKTFYIDWEHPEAMELDAYADDKMLDTTVYRTTYAYDALNRIKLLRYPSDVEANINEKEVRKELKPAYNRAGMLKSVKLDDLTFVEHIAYNAKGQRILIAYGNNVMTRYAYDEKSFRLIRMRAEHYAKPNEFTYIPNGRLFQDFVYEYDLIGNVLKIQDKTPGCGVPTNPDELIRIFTYDPLYRILSATGREHDIATPVPWDNTPNTQDITKTRAYIENYTYDAVGNIQHIHHYTNAQTYNRDFTISPNSNRLKSVSFGSIYQYAYDSCGNLINETTSRYFDWDYDNRLISFREQPIGSEPTKQAYYLYDINGERVKKFIKQGGIIKTTVYIDGIFEHSMRSQGKEIINNNTLHIIDDNQRIAQVRIGSPFPNDTTPSVKYHLSDHLGSSNVVIDDNGELVNREEYTPYGETSFGSFSHKRYRFTGKERDEESGLYYYGARYYAPWLGRWCSCDPAEMIDEFNLYIYAKNNPLRFVDIVGEQPSNSQQNQDVYVDLLNAIPSETIMEKTLLDFKQIVNKYTQSSQATSKGLSFVDIEEIKILDDAHWQQINPILKVNAKNPIPIEIFDIKSKESFTVGRGLGGSKSLHADVEALSPQDTEKIENIFKYSRTKDRKIDKWEKRPVLAMYKREGTLYIIPASLWGIAHAGLESVKAGKITTQNRSQGYGPGKNYDYIKGNKQDGHMCLHFAGSKGHTSKKKGIIHQRNVKTSAKYLQRLSINDFVKKYYNPRIKTPVIIGPLLTITIRK